MNNEYKIERFAILKEYRNKGLGKQAFTYLVDLIISKFNPCTIVLNAQIQTIPFYEKCGFTAEGDEFIEANIKHKRMFLKAGI